MTLEALTASAQVQSIDLVRIDAQRAHPNAVGPLSLGETLRFAIVSSVRVPNQQMSQGFAILSEIDVRWSDDAGESLGVLGLTFRLAYELNAPRTLEPELLMRFATQVATHQSWPFLRERVRALSSELGFPPLLLPLRHLTPNDMGPTRITGTVNVRAP